MPEIVISRDDAGRMTQVALASPPAERNGPTALLGALALGAGLLGWQGFAADDLRLGLIGTSGAVIFALLLVLRVFARDARPAALRLLADAEGLHPRQAPGGAFLSWAMVAGFARDLHPAGLEPRLALLAVPADGGPPRLIAESSEASLPELETALEEFRLQQAG